MPLHETAVELGRGQGILAEHEDEDARMSRQHARAAFSGGRFELTDVGSRNGSALDGVPLSGTVRAAAGQLLRCGQTLFLCSADLRPFRHFGVRVEPRRVEGPMLQQTLRTVNHVAEVSRTLRRIHLC